MTDSSGIRARTDWLGRATAAVRDLPLARREGGRGLPRGEILASGWYSGVEECADVLREVAGGELLEGGAFGGSWPFLLRGDLVVAPALPVVVGPAAVSGADGEYQRRADGVWREGAGVQAPFLLEDPTRTAPGSSFDLLWFSDTERYLVRDGALEIEDLFAVLRVPATSPLLTRILIQPRRLPEAMLETVRWAGPAQEAEIEVGRPCELGSGERWRDARLALEIRADVRSAHQRGSEVVVATERGNNAVFELEESGEGWRLERRAGAYAFTRLFLTRRGDALWLRGVLDSVIDPLAPGMRTRLAYDLRSDLVALG